MPSQWTSLRRASLDYDEEMHWLVKNYNPYKMDIQGNGWYGGQNNKENNKEMPQVGVSRRLGFLCKGLRLPKRLDMQRTP